MFPIVLVVMLSVKLANCNVFTVKGYELFKLTEEDLSSYVLL